MTTLRPPKQRLVDGGTIVLKHRSELIEAPYNPRQIDPVSFKRLVDSVRSTNGLIQPPIWNLRTGHIVGGHQRLKAVDTWKGTQDYSVHVVQIDVDEKTEKELNVKLNSPNLTGEYDLDLLDVLVRNEDFDITNAGFDLISLESMYLASDRDFDIPHLTGTTGEHPEAIAAVDDIDDLLTESNAAKAVEAEAEKIASIKRDKQNSAKRAAFEAETDTFVTVHFPTTEQKQNFMRFLKLPEAAQKADGVAVADFLKIDL